LWFDAIDSRRWNRHNATGPSQSGKTLSCFVIPILYHLFEVGETVVAGVPEMDIAADKWHNDLLPTIERTRYRDLLPRSGRGSRGGVPEAIRFRHGPTLRFMSGGGGDKSRAHFTTRVLVVTETDGMDEQGSGSREADKIAQLEARTRAYGSRRCIYLECTVTTKEGRTWREYTEGTESRILLPCPHCGEYVLPEREHLIGWRQAVDIMEAKERAAFACPSCGVSWDHEDRLRANHLAALVHRGQTIDRRGIISGEAPRTNTLGFRWSAVHNLLIEPGDLGSDEWRALKAVDEDNAEKEMRQFIWCVPYTPPVIELSALRSEGIMARQRSLARGFVPDGTEWLTVGIDIGKFLLHYIVIAFRGDATPHIVDYGRQDVATDQLGTERALLVALMEIRDLCLAGWARSQDQPRQPDAAWFDSGWNPNDVVYQFCRDAGDDRFRPTKGYGTGQDRAAYYQRPRNLSSTTLAIGQDYHLTALRDKQIILVEMDADAWKTWVHNRLTTPIDAAGAMTLFNAPAMEHMALSKHLTAEKPVEEFIAGRGTVRKWRRISRSNHWFDATAIACAAGHFVGARLIEERWETVRSVPADVGSKLMMPDGRAFFPLDR
jgi:phage terminase large subunit GpA-like protein